MSQSIQATVAPAAAIAQKDERPWLSIQAKQKLINFLVGAILPVAVLILWEIGGNTGFVNTDLVPKPSTIAKAGYALVASGEIWHHLNISLQRAGIGFLLGGFLGLAFGIASGFFQRVEKVVDPTAQMLRMVPHLALTPLFILWFGFGEWSKILLIAKGAFFPLYVNTFLGIRNADNRLFEVAQVLNFSRWKQIIHLIIPSSLPNILLGVRISLGVSWLSLVIAELMGSTEGVGFLIHDAQQFSNTETVFIGIIIFAVVGLITDLIVRAFERRLLRWSDTFKG